MSKIALKDKDGRTFVVEENDLLDQLAMINLPGTKPLRTATKNLLALVKQMRDAQKAFFANRSNGQDGSTWLAESKRLEAKVDGAITQFNKIVELL